MKRDEISLKMGCNLIFIEFQIMDTLKCAVKNESSYCAFNHWALLIKSTSLFVN